MFQFSVSQSDLFTLKEQYVRISAENLQDVNKTVLMSVYCAAEMSTEVSMLTS